jgi:hypothetical protein
MRIALLLALVALSSTCTATDFVFDRYYVDQNYGPSGGPGFVRAADMDNDGDLDIPAGGGRYMCVYENDGNPAHPDWAKHGTLDTTAEDGGNGACIIDVDNDGHLDIAFAKYYDDLGWWKNPGGPLSSDPWVYHRLAGATYYLHDFMLADLDRDGNARECIANLNSGYWNANIQVIWFTPSADPTDLWESHVVESGRNEGAPHGHAGLDTGDVDQDGFLDIAYSNGWYEAPDDTTGSWVWHEVTTIYGISNTLLRDMDSDGDLDMIVSAGHHGEGVYLLFCPPDPIGETWVESAVDDTVLHPEGLAALDLDNDGDIDIVSCDLDFDRWDQEVHHVYVYENTGTPFSPSWRKQDVSGGSYASHKLQMADMNKDGRMDIISEGCGYGIVSYYENVTPVGVNESETRVDRTNSPICLLTPNPLSAGDVLRFQTTEGRGLVFEAQVWDAAGRLIASKEFVPEGNSYSFGASLELPSGSYTLTVTWADGTRWQGAFTVIR